MSQDSVSSWLSVKGSPIRVVRDGRLLIGINPTADPRPMGNLEEVITLTGTGGSNPVPCTRGQVSRPALLGTRHAIEV